jgi:hypothetical protein
MAAAAGAAILLAIWAPMLLPTDADAAATASIAGTVAAPSGFQVVVTICAIASGGQEGCASTEATNTKQNSPGAYVISGLAGAEYEVRFTARCSVEPCAETFPPVYYDDQISPTKATHITLAAAEAVAGINAKIEGDLERTEREYLENEGEARPIAEGSGTLPGAIEPAQGNKQLEEEFWANPPWKRKPASETGPATPPAQCVVPALRGDSLAQARRALRKASCTLGSVRKSRGTHGRIVVRKQDPRAGSKLATGAAVAVKLGQATDARRRHS